MLSLFVSNTTTSDPPIPISVSSSGVVGEVRKVLTIDSSRLAIRFSGVYLRDQESLRYMPNQATLFLEPFPEHFERSIRMVVKNFAGEIIDFEAFEEETVLSMKNRFAKIAGIEGSSLHSMLFGNRVLLNTSTIRSNNLKNGMHVLAPVDRFPNLASISRREITMNVTIQFADGFTISMTADPDDTLSMFRVKMIQMDDFKPVSSDIYSMKVGGVVMDHSKTFRELNIKNGAKFTLPCKHVGVTTSDKEKKMSVIVKFLDCSAFYVHAEGLQTMTSFVRMLKSVPDLSGLTFYKLSYKGKVVSHSSVLWELGVQHGDVFIVPEFLPEGANLPGMFFHYDISINIQMEGSDLKEKIFVHSDDPVVFIQHLMENMPEFSPAQIYSAKLKGRVLTYSKSFAENGVRDGATIIVPRK